MDCWWTRFKLKIQFKEYQQNMPPLLFSYIFRIIEISNQYNMLPLSPAIYYTVSLQIIPLYLQSHFINMYLC